MSDFIKNLFSYSKGKFVLNIIFMVLDGVINGTGIALLVPLLSLAGISGVGGTPIPLPHTVSRLFEQLGPVASLAAVLAVYFFLTAAEAFLAARISVKNTEIVQGYTRHLRETLYQSFVKAEWSYIAGKKKSDLINSFTNEIARIATGAVFFFSIVSQCILAVSQLILAFIMSVQLTFVVLFCAAVILLLTKSVFHKSQALGGDLRLINQELISQVSEQMNAIREIKVYGIEETQQNSFGNTTEKMQSNQNTFARLQSGSGRRYKIYAALIISVLFFVSFEYIHISPALLIILIYIFARLWPLFISLQNNAQNIMAMMPSFISLKKLTEGLRQHAEKTINSGCISTKISAANSIRFENVSFDYGEPGAFELKNLNFEIKAKSITALVGKSGAGKTTIVDLLLGLLRPREGQILADGLPIDDRAVSDWRRRIGYVPQEPFLFNGSIRDNLLRFFPCATEADIKYALKLADACEFIEKLPGDIDTPVGDNGVRLSGGQRQRIVLARSLLGKPEILVLDEATSSLDSESELRIQNALEILSQKLTIIVIAHRLSTIRNAGRIIVVEDGRIAEQGNYEELSNKEGYFNRILQAGSYITGASCMDLTREGLCEVCEFTAPGESI